MRILMLSYEFPPIGGGGAGVVHGLSSELALMGHEVDVVTMAFRNLPRHERVNGVHVHRVPCVRLHETHCTMAEQATYLVTALPYALRLVREREHDVNHTHFIVPDGAISMLLRKRTGLPYLITSHGSDVPGYNPERFRGTHRVLAPAWRRIVEGAEGIACPSESLRDLILRSKADARTRIIPNGVSSDRFRPDRPKEKRILVVSRMVERKGIQFLFRAVQGLDLEHEVVVVGDGPYLERLRDLARELDLEVDFRGWLDRNSSELTDLYETSDIYVLPSEAENFPMVLLEAMGGGAAIITSRGTGCAEVVGDTALLVDPHDVEGIRDALVRLTGDPELRRRLSSAARRRLEDNFTWRAVAERYVEYYAECAQRAR